MKNNFGYLYIIAAPIGNLSDITYRAVEHLRSVDIIAAEDTRTAGKLLKRYDIRAAKIISYEEHSEVRKSPELIALLKEGKSIALISEGGTPLISDPGYRLVREARQNNINVVPIPGVSAVTAALSAAGAATDMFTFYGFLPRKKESRRKMLTKIAATNHTVVLFESPHRIMECLTDISEILEDRELILCREMTKLYEEFLCGTASQIKDKLTLRKEKVRGEITLVIGKNENTRSGNNVLLNEHEIYRILTEEAELKPSRAAGITAKITGIPKSEIYSRCAKKNRR